MSREIKTLVLGVDVFPRVCDITNTGMDRGWYLGGEYITDNLPNGEGNDLLKNFVEKNFNQTVQEFWDEIQSDEMTDSEYYWTEWTEIEDCAYLQNGVEIITDDGKIYSDDEGNLYSIVKE